jgi:hypothetical protein
MGTTDHQHDAGITQHLPPCCEPLLTGGIAGAKGPVIVTTGTHKQQQRQDDQHGGQRGRELQQERGPNDKNPRTHHHRCEQLLTGWIVGDTNNGEDDKGSKNSGTTKWEQQEESSR